MFISLEIHNKYLINYIPFELIVMNLIFLAILLFMIVSLWLKHLQTTCFRLRFYVYIIKYILNTCSLVLVSIRKVFSGFFNTFFGNSAIFIMVRGIKKKEYLIK